MKGFGSPSSTSHDGEGDDNHDSRHITNECSTMRKRWVICLQALQIRCLWRERIEVGLKRGKFDYATSTRTSNTRFGMGGAKKKDRDAHVVTLAPTWPKSQQTPHNPTYPYSSYQCHYSANIETPPNPAPIQQRLPTQPQTPPPQNAFPA